MDDDAKYEVIARYTSEREVRGALESLTLAGIGATYESTAGPDPALGKVVFALQVVPGDGNRAREVLGLEPEPGADESPGARRFPDWAYVLAVFIAAMIIIPAAAFFLSYKLSGG